MTVVHRLGKSRVRALHSGVRCSSYRTLVEAEGQAAILGRYVSQLVSSPVIFADGNGNILVDIEGCDQRLRENIDNVVIGIGAVVELGAKRVLPLLRLQHMVSIGSVDYESFKVQLAYTFNLGSHLEVGIEVIAKCNPDAREGLLRD